MGLLHSDADISQLTQSSAVVDSEHLTGGGSTPSGQSDPPVGDRALPSANLGKQCEPRLAVPRDLWYRKPV